MFLFSVSSNHSTYTRQVVIPQCDLNPPGEIVFYNCLVTIVYCCWERDECIGKERANVREKGLEHAWCSSAQGLYRHDSSLSKRFSFDLWGSTYLWCGLGQTQPKLRLSFSSWTKSAPVNQRGLPPGLYLARNGSCGVRPASGWGKAGHSVKRRMAVSRNAKLDKHHICFFIG